jgi:TRAP-type C4-dicarboxylate transport system permease small subunit
MVFLPMAWCAITDGHVSMNVIANRLPRLPRTVLAAVFLFLSTSILAVLTWQLFVYAARQQAMAQATILMGIPTSPFLYAATLGMLLMTIVFFMKFLVSLYAIRRRK